MQAKVGDFIKFKKIKWTIVEVRKVWWSRVVYYKYVVHRRYFGLWLRNTECSYDIFPSRWSAIKKKVAKNKNYYPSQLVGWR